MKPPFATAPLTRFAILLALVLAGCAEVDRLREAQTAFNDAATADNELRLGAVTRPTKGTDALPDATRASAGYARVVSLIEGLDEKQRAKLQSERLWGVALTLEAISYWRLNEYDKALSTARAFAALPPEQRYPRDQALSVALPGLIRISQAHQSIFAQRDETGIERTRRRQAVTDQLNCALRDLDGALAGASVTDPQFIYLVQAELSAIRNQQDAQLYLAGEVSVLQGADLKRAQCRMWQLDDAIKKASTADDAARAVKFWNDVIEVTPDAASCVALPAPVCPP